MIPIPADPGVLYHPYHPAAATRAIMSEGASPISEIWWKRASESEGTASPAAHSERTDEGGAILESRRAGIGGGDPGESPVSWAIELARELEGMTSYPSDHSVPQGGTCGLSQPITFVPSCGTGHSVPQGGTRGLSQPTTFVAAGPPPSHQWDRHIRQQNYPNDPVWSTAFYEKKSAAYHGNKGEVIHSIGGGADRAKMEQEEGAWTGAGLIMDLTTRKVRCGRGQCCF